MRLDEALKHPQIGIHTTDGYLHDGQVSWHRRDHLLYCTRNWDSTQLMYFDTTHGDLQLCMSPSAQVGPYNMARNMLNDHLPNQLRVKSVKKDRWVITGLDNARSVPYYNNITLNHPSPQEWVVHHTLPYPDKRHIPQPIQHLVKKWAGSYHPTLRGGRACGMCIPDEDSRLTAARLDGGTHERQHLLDHILTGRLPKEFVMGILHEARQPPFYLVPGDVAPFRQACYQVAVWYAYKTLRSTYA
jgi:hypothetical protein